MGVGRAAGKNKAEDAAKMAVSSPLMETLGGIAIAAVIVYSGWRVISGGQTPGAFFSFLTALLLAYDPAKRLAKVNVDLNAVLPGVRMYFDFLDTPAAEGPAEGVGEDERPGDEGDAEDDGEGAHEQAALAGHQPGIRQLADAQGEIEPAAHQVDDAHPGGIGHLPALAVRCRDARAAGQGHTQCLGQGVHRQRSAHGVAVTHRRR